MWVSLESPLILLIYLATSGLMLYFIDYYSLIIGHYSRYNCPSNFAETFQSRFVDSSVFLLEIVYIPSVSLCLCLSLPLIYLKEGFIFAHI